MALTVALELNHVQPLAFCPAPDSEIWNHSLRLTTGAYWKLAGPSGSGKTSLFAFLAGIRRDYLGTISLHTEQESISLEALKETGWTRLRSQVFSVVSQDLSLIRQISLADNFRIKANLSTGKTVQDLTNRYSELSDYLEIADLVHQKPSTISRGELQRATIIIALLQPFDFLILDEAFSHLDSRLRLRAADLIQRECQARGAGAVILDLHNDDLFPYQAVYHFGVRSCTG